MTVNPDTTFSGNTIVEDLYIYGKLIANEDEIAEFGDVRVDGTLEVGRKIGQGILGIPGIATFHDNVYLKQNLEVFGESFLRNDVVIGNIGVGNVKPAFVGIVTQARVGIGTSVAEQTLDVNGSIKITKDIYDSNNSSGANGFYLNQDNDGIVWLPVSPGFSEGIFVQDEGTYLQNAGAAVSFTVLNFVNENSAGLGTDTLVPIPDPANPTFIGKIQTRDLWGFTGQGNSASIFRMTRVGINNNNPSAQLDIDGTIHATGAADFDSSLNVDGPTVLNGQLTVVGVTQIQNTFNVTQAVDFDQTLNVDGNITAKSGLDVDGSTTLNANLDVDGTTVLRDTLNVQGEADFDDTANFDSEVVFNSSVEYNSIIKDINNDDGVGAAQTDYRLAAVGSGVSWRPSGVQTKKTIWVTKNGMDSNSGLLEGDAKATIAGAAAIAVEGDTIKVRSGVYQEANPIGLRTDVAITGEDLRLVTIVPTNANRDVFHVRRGCMIENVSFAGTSNTAEHARCAAVAFPPLTLSERAVSGYQELGPANEGASGRYKSPYVRNCTNFMKGSIGMKIDGDHVNAAFTGINSLGQDIKSMVCDSFTQYNEAGIGVSLTNNGYAQLVSIFTIGCDIAIFAKSGGQCDLTNSNSSFGNFGLYADGVGATEFTSTTVNDVTAGSDTFILRDMRDTANNVRRPFDGQAFFFKLDLDDYNDVSQTGITTAPLTFVRSIKITDGGTGYSQSAPPNVTIVNPKGPEAIKAELSANVSIAGTITSVDVVASGRNFLPNQDISVSFSGDGGATAIAEMDPIYFTVSEATEPTVSGLTTVTFNEFVPYSVSMGSTCELKRISRIITSSHSFEYIGAGNDLNTANPFQGGVPKPENEIVAINGGQIPFTSTDQKGNFRIGEGLVIDQTTSTISGRDFNRAIQAQLTPLILALR